MVEEQPQTAEVMSSSIMGGWLALWSSRRLQPGSASPLRCAWCWAGPPHRPTTPQTARGRRSQLRLNLDWVKRTERLQERPRLHLWALRRRPPQPHQAAGTRCQAGNRSRPLVPFICWIGWPTSQPKASASCPVRRCEEPCHAASVLAGPAPTCCSNKRSEVNILSSSICFGSWRILEDVQTPLRLVCTRVGSAVLWLVNLIST